MNHQPIAVRQPDYHFDDLPRHFFGNNPMLTALFTALSLTFPSGEKFFVHSVRQVRDQISDPILQKQVSGFIGQEAMHSLLHRRFNARLAQFGLNTRAVLQAEEQATAWVKSKLSPAQQLAITCALEHFTAILAKYMLQHPEFHEQFDASIQKLWLWHALEETEHKAVAFDVFQTVFADQTLRKRFMRLITLSFSSRMTYLTLSLLWQDKAGRWQFKSHLKAIRTLQQLIKSVLPEYLAYFDDRFHPNDFDSTQLTSTWTAQLGFNHAA